MQNCRLPREQIRTGKKAGIWLALAVALGLHSIILFLPISRQTPGNENAQVQLELQLTTFNSQPPVMQALPRQPAPEPIPEISKSLVEAQPETETPMLTPIPQERDLAHDLENMSEQKKRRLTNTILFRQFFTEEPAADQLFGKPLEQNSSELQREFHYPLRQNMIAMLDQPMPELPFAYTPGLINFAYAPGAKGDFQRFWDVITPEFGWITDNGTEFKCIWVLIVGGCGWK